MYTLINYILTLFYKYDSMYEFYTCELSMHLSVFQTIMCIIVYTSLFIIFIIFLIKRYTFKGLILLILKRIIVVTFIFFSIYLFSSFTLCETQVNKNIGNYINTDTKKYICIALVTVTGCYVAYKYVPGWYNGLKSYSKYKDNIYTTDQYLFNFKLYLEYIENKKALKINQIENLNYFNFVSKKYNLIISNYILNSTNSQDNIKLLSENLEIQKANTLLISKYAPFRMKDELNFKLSTIIKNYEKSCTIIKNLKNSKEMYAVNLKEIEIIHGMLLVNIATLIDFYPLYIFNEINKIKQIESRSFLFEFEDNLIMSRMSREKMVHNLILLESLIDNTLNSSNQLLSGIESISTFPLLSEYLKTNFILKEVQKPLNFKIVNIDYPLDNLEGLKFVCINFGYICFYPILYCSNKIFGTFNPLSFKNFKEAFWFFFPFSGFF